MPQFRVTGSVSVRVGVIVGEDGSEQAGNQVVWDGVLEGASPPAVLSVLVMGQQSVLQAMAIEPDKEKGPQILLASAMPNLRLPN
jgi:hypothetical protein